MADIAAVPMDKYTRQSQLSNIRARRKNTTASLILQCRLKYLEKGYNRGCKKFARDKIRTEQELRDLVPADDSLLDLDSPRNTSTSMTRGPRSQASQVVGGGRDLSHRRRNPPSECVYREESESSVGAGSSPRQTCSSMSASLRTTGDSPDFNRPRALARGPSYLAGRSMTDISPGAESASRRGSGACSRASTSSSVCRYSRDQKFHTCKYFPCTVPTTYHTLGLRRDDLVPNISDEGLGASNTRNISQRSRSFHSSRAEQFPQATHESTQTLPNCSSATSPRWGQKTDQQSFQFQRAKGPVFGPKPPDPILEHVRSGSTNPLPVPQSTSRVSVRDRIRGLNQLVREMRAKNDVTRPVDRAVNYGRRLPMRVLLNPVVPVSI